MWTVYFVYFKLAKCQGVLIEMSKAQHTLFRVTLAINYKGRHGGAMKLRR
jgi:hypothetical protein